MKVLVGLIAYDRMAMLDYWFRAWSVAYKPYDTSLVVVQNTQHDLMSRNMTRFIKERKPDHFLERENTGQDIGALRDIIHNTSLDPWDVLLWFVDDNIPVRRDFISAFVDPFVCDSNIGLVGNHWVKGSFYSRYKAKVVPDHFRTTCFAIRQDAARKLIFPDRIVTKWDCYDFEWSGANNMTQQIKTMGLDALPVERDWNASWVDMNKYVWDMGSLHNQALDPRCRKDFSKQYLAQFNSEK